MAKLSISCTGHFHRQWGFEKAAHLTIGKAAKLEAAIWSPQCKDPRVHHARERRGVPERVKEGVGNEALCRLLRPVEDPPC